MQTSFIKHLYDEHHSIGVGPIILANFEEKYSGGLLSLSTNIETSGTITRSICYTLLRLLRPAALRHVSIDWSDDPISLFFLFLRHFVVESVETTEHNTVVTLHTPLSCCVYPVAITEFMKLICHPKAKAGRYGPAYGTRYRR